MSQIHDRVAVLDRQAALIDTLMSGIEKRRAQGIPVELAVSVLDGERALYRKMLSESHPESVILHGARRAEASRA